MNTLYGIGFDLAFVSMEMVQAEKKPHNSHNKKPGNM